MGFPRGETVTRLRAMQARDPYSGELADLSWNTPDELEIPDAAFSPAGSTELAIGGALVRVSDAAAVYVHDRDADVRSGDRIRREKTGVVYAVEGRPAVWDGAYFGLVGGTVISLRELS